MTAVEQTNQAQIPNLEETRVNSKGEDLFDDYTSFEPDFLFADAEMNFFDKLPETSEVKPGITKWIIKAPKQRKVVEPNSRVSVSKLHWTYEGMWEKKNNPNYQSEQKLKLGGESDQELVECVRTMCPGEISYFKIERSKLDADEP